MTHRRDTAAMLPDVETPAAQLAGRFHYSILYRNRPRTLLVWHIITDERIAERTARLLGGRPHHLTAGQAEITTTAATVPVLLDGPGALRAIWQSGPERACDGATQRDGRPCACPATLALRRASAKQGHGCQPHAEVRFRVQGDPALGVFAFASEDWSFVGLVTEAQTRLHGEAPVTARLSLRRTLHLLRGGREFAYTRPVLTLDEHPL